MRYLVVGAGGTGGSIGGFLAKGGKDVTLIARGAHLRAIQKKGLILHCGDGKQQISVPAVAQEDYREQPDVIFVCLKSYALPEIMLFLGRISGSRTHIIPILNGYGAGERIAKAVPMAVTLDGCIYIFANKTRPGEVTIHGDLFRIVYGTRRSQDISPRLLAIKRDLLDCGIDASISSDIRRDVFQKLSYVSPMAAVGAYHNANAGQIQNDPKSRELFLSMVGEVVCVARAIGISFEENLLQKNLEMLKSADPLATTSLQKDLQSGGRSELDEIVFSIVKLGIQNNVPTPKYREVAKHFGFRER